MRSRHLMQSAGLRWVSNHLYWGRVHWSMSLVNAYGLNGEGLLAIELFRRMPPEWIDETSALCVLNACSHSGLVDQAREIFETVTVRTEKIFTAMVRGGSPMCSQSWSSHFRSIVSVGHFSLKKHKILSRHLNVIITQVCPCTVSDRRSDLWTNPHCLLLVALLSGARNQTNPSFSQEVFDRMKKLFADQKHFVVQGSVLLANVYGASGNMHKASQVQAHLNRSDTKKEVGLAWTEVDGQLTVIDHVPVSCHQAINRLQEFRAHDRSHPQASLIYAELEELSKELIEHGHQFDSSWITRPLKRNETIESVLCGHSEKLAIAFNFIQGRRPSRIQVTKNLRVCGDCRKWSRFFVHADFCS